MLQETNRKGANSGFMGFFDTRKMNTRTKIGFKPTGQDFDSGTKRMTTEEHLVPKADSLYRVCSTKIDEKEFIASEATNSPIHASITKMQSLHGGNATVPADSQRSKPGVDHCSTQDMNRSSQKAILKKGGDGRGEEDENTNGAFNELSVERLGEH